MQAVGECGLVGAVGGAAVGMLAGGPVGAVIGAVVCGVASTAALSALERHGQDGDTPDADATPPPDACTRQVQAGLHPYVRD